MLTGEHEALNKMASAALTFHTANDARMTALTCHAPKEIAQWMTDKTRITALDLVAAAVAWRESR